MDIFDCYAAAMAYAISKDPKLRAKVIESIKKDFEREDPLFKFMKSRQT